MIGMKELTHTLTFWFQYLTVDEFLCYSEFLVSQLQMYRVLTSLKMNSSNEDEEDTELLELGERLYVRILLLFFSFIQTFCFWIKTSQTKIFQGLKSSSTGTNLWRKSTTNVSNPWTSHSDRYAPVATSNTTTSSDSSVFLFLTSCTFQFHFNTIVNS
jgi:cytoskeletal protein RodZ